jgi:hypothetical protein
VRRRCTIGARMCSNVFAPLDMAITDIEICSGPPHHLTIPPHAQHRLGDRPCLGAVAAGIHRQRSAHRSGNPGEKLRANQSVRRGKARDLRARYTGLGIDQPLAARHDLGVHELQPAMHEDDRAAQTAIADEQIAAEPDHMHRLIRGNGAHEAREIFEVARKVSAIRRPACAPAGVFAHRLVQAKLAAEPALGNPFQFSHVHASYTCPF